MQLERNAINNVQYRCCESLVINPVPATIGDDVLESSVCRALSLMGREGKPDYLQACHHLEKRTLPSLNLDVGSKNIASLSTERTSNESDVLTQLNFSGRFFVSESMYLNLINVDSCKMLAIFIPHGFGITLSMLNLMKEVNL